MGRPIWETKEDWRSLPLSIPFSEDLQVFLPFLTHLFADWFFQRLFRGFPPWGLGQTAIDRRKFWFQFKNWDLNDEDDIKETRRDGEKGSRLITEF